MGARARSAVGREGQQAGRLALFSKHTIPAFLDGWAFHLRSDHGQPFCRLSLSLHICKMGRVGALLAAGKIVSP